MGLDASNLISGLAGAAIGGVSAIAGGIWVNRREIIRDARTRIYQDLLPPLLNQEGYRTSDRLLGQLRALRRIAPRTTSGDRRAIDQLWRIGVEVTNAALAAVGQQTLNQETGRMEAPRPVEEPFQRLSDRFLSLVKAFDERLRNRIL